MSGPARSSRRRVAAGFRSRRRLEISSLDDEDADAMRATRRETRRVSAVDPRDAARDARAGEGIGTRREGMYRDGSVRARRDVSSRAEVGTHAGLFLRSVRIGDIRFRGNSSASSPAASAPRAGGSFARTRTMPPAPIAAPNAAAPVAPRVPGRHPARRETRVASRPPPPRHHHRHLHHNHHRRRRRSVVATAAPADAKALMDVAGGVLGGGESRRLRFEVAMNNLDAETHGAYGEFPLTGLLSVLEHPAVAAALESEGSSSCSDDDGSRSVGGSSSEDESSSGSSRSAFRDALAIANDPSRAEPVLVDVGSGAGRLLLAAATMRCVL